MSCMCGGREVTTNEPLYSHDFIELFPRTPSRIYEECAPLYESGLSIRDIEERTGIPKFTVRETLKKSGMALRNPLNGNASHIDRLHTKRGGHTPYGYAYLDGKLLIDPKELNRQKIPSRADKSWSPCVVRRVIKFDQSNQQNNRRTK